ncbi:hypothetical protein B0A49_05841 [Cryomyces minteri]|uniref:Uncharacterized protein n=1 Tax=Cryomyces minteri TaxID=331657 RepID=A0A4U0X7J3_9PEZI|nr:hypothetical protein B0A49_05841 [Cryomyces minteri]
MRSPSLLCSLVLLALLSRATARPLVPTRRATSSALSERDLHLEDTHNWRRPHNKPFAPPSAGDAPPARRARATHPGLEAEAAADRDEANDDCVASVVARCHAVRSPDHDGDGGGSSSSSGGGEEKRGFESTETSECFARFAHAKDYEKKATAQQPGGTESAREARSG